MMGNYKYPRLHLYPPTDNPLKGQQFKNVCHYCKKQGHVIRDCRKWKRKEQVQRNEPSFENTKLSKSRAFALFPHCQRTNFPPENCWSGPNANRTKRLKRDQPAENTKEGKNKGI